MKKVSDVTACVCDHGLFLPLAIKLGEQLKKVYYWNPSERVMPRISEGVIGDGFDTVEGVIDLWSVKKDCDLFVFPDVGFAGLQQELIAQGYPVWGHHGADVLETDRGFFLETIESLGMDLPGCEKIYGLTNLGFYLRSKTDKWVKISKWRGDWETLHWRSWREDEGTLDQYAYQLGPAKELIWFYVFDPIDTDIEDGLDSYCIDGQFPQIVMHGLECKDKSYLCSVQPMKDISPQVRLITDQFGPVLGSYGYRGFFSGEVRIKGDKSYFIDPTTRAASPPSQVMTELYDNLGEIVWHGANGELVEPEPNAKFGVQALLTVDREKDEWVSLDIPDEIKQFVKCGFACQIKDMLCIPPHPLGNMIGWLVATGPTIADAIDDLKERAAALPDGVECDVKSLTCLLEEMQAAERLDIEFTKQTVPPPEIVLDKT